MKDDTNKAIAFFLLLGILICFLEVWCSRPKEKPMKEEISIAQHKDDSLQKENGLLNKKIEGLQVANDSLQEKLSQVKTFITQLKKEQHEKINHIDSLNGHELYGFFSGIKAPDRTGR